MIFFQVCALRGPFLQSHLHLSSRQPAGEPVGHTGRPAGSLLTVENTSQPSQVLLSFLSTSFLQAAKPCSGYNPPPRPQFLPEELAGWGLSSLHLLTRRMESAWWPLLRVSQSLCRGCLSSRLSEPQNYLLQLCVGRGTGCGMHIRLLARLQTPCQSQRAVWEAGRRVGEQRAQASRSAFDSCSLA